MICFYNIIIRAVNPIEMHDKEWHISWWLCQNQTNYVICKRWICVRETDKVGIGERNETVNSMNSRRSSFSLCVCVCVVLCFHIYLETTKNQQQVTTKQQYLHISIQENFYFFYKKKHAQVFLRLDHFRWNQTLWLKKQDFKDKLGFGFELDSC